MMLHRCLEPHHTQMNTDTHMLAAAAGAAAAAAAAMGQRVAGPSLQEEEGMMGMEARREQLHILLHHCWSMKRQETRLRLVTLLLMLTCASLYVFKFCKDLNGSSQPVKPSGSGEQSALYISQKQDRLPYVQLRSIRELNNGTMMWQGRDAESSFRYDETRGAIVVPETGIYFLYVTFQLARDCKSGTFEPLTVVVVSGADAYCQSPVSLMSATDGVMCSSKPVLRTVFLGEQMQLSKGDGVSVQVKEGYDLISFAKLGAYFIKFQT